MEQRVWREGLAVGCDLREVASRRADGSSHVLMGCLKPRDTKKWVVFRGIITDSKGNRNVQGTCIQSLPSLGLPSSTSTSYELP